jgi:glyoxylase-like metal-dependent hydrolase (beta-lactamase superfamily II)
MQKHVPMLVAGVAPFLFALPALAQEPVAAQFVTHQLRPNVYYIEGGGGHSGVIVGDNGVIVIDAKTTPAGGKELLEDIARITNKPVNTVILTHSDADHVNGLASFPAGLTIIAQENNKKEQESALARGVHFAPPADHLPTKLVKNSEDLTIDGVKLQLRHWSPAHTSGDLVVFIPAEKIVFAGDLLTEHSYPLIHMEKTGSSDGWIESVKGLLAFDAATYVPGHGKLQTKADLQQELADAEARKALIKKMVAEGKSLQEIKDALGEKPQPPAVPGGPPRFPTFTETTYQELTAKKIS